MKAYIVITGLMFAALVAVHGARLYEEGGGPLHDPVFLIATSLGAVMAVWAVLLLRRLGTR
jgi:hypothetical protein